MMNWFGKKKETEKSSTVSATSASRPADPQATIVKLRESIMNQEKREEHLQKKMDQMVVDAKEKMAKGDKKGALFAMKRKKLYEGEIDKIQNVKMTLETQVFNLESATQNAETFKAMEAGSKTMKKIRQEVGIEEVDEVMDSIKEEMDIAKDINDAFAQPLDPLLADDDELLKELQDLETKDLETSLLAPPTKNELHLPTVPNKKLPKLAKDEEDELKKLEAELAGL